MNRLTKLLRRIRGFSTPLGGLSFDPQPKNMSKDAFSIGFDLNLLSNLGLFMASSNISEPDAYDSQRILLDERAARAGIKLELPISVVNSTPEEVSLLFKKLNQEASARLQAVHESNALPYSLGRWLAEILAATSGAQSASPEQIGQLFSPLITRFEHVIEGAHELGASRASKRALSALRDELTKMSKQQTVTNEQYALIAKEVIDLARDIGSHDVA